MRQLAVLVQEWIAAGSPPSFIPPSSGDDAGPGGDAGTSGSYSMTPSSGNAMTNIGNCVPGSGLFGISAAHAKAMDAMFAGLHAQTTGTAAQIIGLPEHLGETDLVTFDSTALAQSGVVAYAPGYPLWTDNAGKLRYVRVPFGQSIQFDKTTQQFKIPANTRFYKTFMKQIADTDGSDRHRKIEPRPIVTRPDQNNADGTVAQTALYGTYKWNDNETDAVLVESPLDDGLPFADTVFLYNTDEALAADILKGQPAAPEEALLEGQAARHYAIPSSQRCVQCHMGSPSEAFVLGFTPLQVNRRPTGTGGIIEEAGPDELTQLQRFIDLGIISGIDSPSDVLPLEGSQGTRAPRNDYELVAQGYMLGNCAHCHNPRGYPTVQNPVLLNVLDFLPSQGAVGGIFQFPLESYSPRIGRGLTGTTLIPYITPSLVDLPKLDPDTGGQAADWFVRATPGSGVIWVDYAPWRSIIYRNVDAAFAYTDDLALFPHMPMNSLGYDPRAKQILGDWMVSIPAIRKQPEIPEFAYQIDSNPADNINGAAVDSTPQPYIEVMPGDPRYQDAANAVAARMSIFHTGTNPAVPLSPSLGVLYSRYADPGETDDILDPAVELQPICHPIPTADSVDNHYPLPNHPHWVTTDTTQTPGPWSPRRADWANVLVKQDIPPAPSGACAPPGQEQAYQDQVDAVGILQNTALDQVRTYVTTPVPFGLWQPQSGCDFSGVPTVQSFTGASRPHWMDVPDPESHQRPAANAPVYSLTPGAAVFKMICINCHGPNADSNGRMAFNLAIMTGGQARVADFKDGLFGPVGASDATSNRESVFGTAPLSAALSASLPANWTTAPDGTPLTDDDRAARYMPWMALGGTEVLIPKPILQIVAATKVLDLQRAVDSSQISANMLSQAKALCMGLLGPTSDKVKVATFNGAPGHGYLDADITFLNTTLLPSIGDAELWLRMCTLDNPSPVRVLTPAIGSQQYAMSSYEDTTFAADLEIGGLGTWIAPGDYPANTPVGNETGGIDPSLATTNMWPWCVDPTPVANVPNPAWLQQAIDAGTVPVCPESVLQIKNACFSNAGTSCYGTTDANRWAVRGAINAGMSVFLYVQSIENTGPAPDYDQCNLLTK